MQYIGNCPHCGGELKSISIGLVCEKCGGFVDMKGEIHKPVNELFIPDDVLKEHDEITGGKYRRAIERMGRFGQLFFEEETADRENETAIMPRVTDLAGNDWLPVRLDAFRKTEAKIKELRQRAEKAERDLGEAREAICQHCQNVPCQREKCYWYRGNWGKE